MRIPSGARTTPMCNITNNIQDILANYIEYNKDDDDKDDDENDEEEKGKEREQYQANVFTNIMRRIVCIYEYGFISW